MKKDGTGRLNFYQNLKYKSVEMFNLDFVASNEEMVCQSLAYRYNAWCAKLKFMQNRCKDVNAVLKQTNPTLLTQILKGKSQER